MRFNVIVIFALAILVTSCSQTETIKIGLIAPLTGDVSLYGIPAQKNVMLALEELNEEGGVNGIPIEIIYEDSKCDPKEGVSAANKLISVDKVDALLASVCSSVAVPVYPIAENAGIFTMGYGASSPDLTKNTPYYYRTFPSDALQAKVGAELTILDGNKKIAVIHANDEHGEGLKEHYVDNIKKLGGEIVIVETHNNGDVDFKTQLEKIKRSEIEMVYLVSFPKEGGLILKQARELGIDVPFRGTETLNDISTIEVAGNAAEGLKITWPAIASGPTHEKYREAFREKFNEEPTAFGPEVYDALKIVVKAMKYCGIDRDEIKKCLDNMPIYNGASGQIVFDEFGDIQKPYDVFEVVDGEFVKVT